ncbi:MAG: T9SS type A sorting domain-containing protein [Chitinophagales bacterium]|nr:T9SS type A sorting domain-containing protein [Chitinophagales bacterium]
MNTQHFKLLAMLCIVLFSTTATQLLAADITWTGGGDGSSWSDSNNWDTGTVPTNEDIAYISGTAHVVVDASVEVHLLRLAGDATLFVTTAGQMLFPPLPSDSKEIVQLEDNASLINGGIVMIKGNTFENPIEALDNSSINNFGTLIIDPLFSEAAYIRLRDLASITNSGEISVLSPEYESINMGDETSIINHGTINIKNSSAIALELRTSSSVENYGVFRIEDNLISGIALYGDAVFNNHATLELINVGGTYAVRTRSEARFINKPSGNVNIIASSIWGLFVSSGEMLNYGHISLQTNKVTADDTAIYLNCDALFKNDGILEITATGIAIQLGDNVSCPSTEFINEACGEIYILSQSKIVLDQLIPQFFTNNGFLSTVFTGTNINYGTFLNNGQIYAPGGFMTSPDPVINGSTFPLEWQSSTIGNPGVLGNNFDFQACNEEFVISGGGNNLISTITDNVAFAHQSLCGNDITITAKVENLTPNGYGGLMIRETGDANSKQVAIFSNLNNSLRHETRYMAGANKVVQNFVKPSPVWLRLQRQGNWVYAYYSTNGAFFQYVHAVYIPLSDCIEIGLVSFTYFPNTQTEATFSNVEIVGGVMMPYAEAPEIVETAAIKQMASVYPNPTSDIVNLVFEDGLNENATVILRNQLGQIIEQRELFAGEAVSQWDITHLVDGLYFFEVYQKGEKSYLLKLAKTR